MKRSLHIGINDYPGVGSDLSGCVNDAMDWKKALEAKGFNESWTLLDKQAKKEEMLTAISKIVCLTGPKDIGVITYSGHGTWVPDQDGDEADGRDEALCPWDIGTSGVVITDDELFEVFSQRQHGARIIFVSDSCHSGSVSRASVGMPGTKDDGWKFQRMRFLAPEYHLSKDLLPVARRVEKSQVKSKIRAATVLMAGCQDHEYSYDAWFNQRPNGAFTYVALKVLAEMTSANSYLDWYKAIRCYLPHVQYPQTPQLHCARYQRQWKILAE